MSRSLFPKFICISDIHEKALRQSSAFYECLNYDFDFVMLSCVRQALLAHELGHCIYRSDRELSESVCLGLPDGGGGYATAALCGNTMLGFDSFHNDFQDYQRPFDSVIVVSISGVGAHSIDFNVGPDLGAYSEPGKCCGINGCVVKLPRLCDWYRRGRPGASVARTVGDWRWSLHNRLSVDQPDNFDGYETESDGPGVARLILEVLDGADTNRVASANKEPDSILRGGEMASSQCRDIRVKSNLLSQLAQIRKLAVGSVLTHRSADEEEALRGIYEAVRNEVVRALDKIPSPMESRPGIQAYPHDNQVEESVKSVEISSREALAWQVAGTVSESVSGTAPEDLVENASSVDTGFRSPDLSYEKAPVGSVLAIEISGREALDEYIARYFLDELSEAEEAHLFINLSFWGINFDVLRMFKEDQDAVLRESWGTADNLAH